jgi:hypothetical protein
MPQNGDVNNRFAVYRSLCCGREILVREGMNFPDCPNHPKLTTVWKIVKTEVIEFRPVKRTKSKPA